MPKLEPTFETLVDTFVFLDENKDGLVSREEMVRAIDESGERSSGRIAMKRFGLVSHFLSPLTEQRILILIQLFVCRGDGLGQEWNGELQRVLVRIYAVGWNR